MRAIVREKYGLSDELKLQDVEKPSPKANEVQIRVHAVSLNASDVENMTGSPLYIRAWGLFKPKFKILGSDIAGTVERVGNKVSKFKTGDAVFGDALYVWGGFAEYACVPENMLRIKPDNLSYEEASTLPQSAVVAYQGVRHKKKIGEGKKVLINGAGGGSGTFAIQMAKILGAEVTGVDSQAKLDPMRALGADHVIDFRQEDFTKNEEQYDLILDLTASHSVFDYKKALRSDGVYGMVGGFMRHIFQTIVIGGLLGLFGKKKIGMVLIRPNEDLEAIIELITSGKLKPVIDKIYPFEKIPEAMRYMHEGRACGKLVIRF